MFKYRIDNDLAFVSNSEKEIQIPINDFKQKTMKLGFSIKSQLGSPATSKFK